MTRKFFYSTKLEKLISDLKLRGELDETNLKNINDYVHSEIKKHVGLIIVLFIIFALVATVSLKHGMLLIILFLFLVNAILFGLWQNTQKKLEYSVLFGIGEKTIGKIMRCEHFPPFSEIAAPSWLIEYTFYDSNNKKHNHFVRLLSKWNDKNFSSGEAIDVYYINDRRMQSIIALPQLLNFFNLKKNKV